MCYPWLSDTSSTSLERVGGEEAAKDGVEGGLKEGAAGELADPGRQLDQLGDGGQGQLLGPQRDRVVLQPGGWTGVQGCVLQRKESQFDCLT